MKMTVSAKLMSMFSSKEVQVHSTAVRCGGSWLPCVVPFQADSSHVLSSQNS